MSAYEGSKMQKENELKMRQQKFINHVKKVTKPIADEAEFEYVTAQRNEWRMDAQDLAKKCEILVADKHKYEFQARELNALLKTILESEETKMLARHYDKAKDMIAKFNLPVVGIGYKSRRIDNNPMA